MDFYINGYFNATDGCHTSSYPSSGVSIETCYCSTDLCNSKNSFNSDDSENSDNLDNSENSGNVDNSSAFHGVTLDLFYILFIIYHLK